MPETPESPVRPSCVSRAAWGIAWAIAGLLAAVAALRILWHDGTWALLLANAATPYLYLPAAPIALVAALRRRTRLAALATALVALYVAWVGPELAAGDPPKARGRGLRVVSANLLMVHPRPAALAREIARADADVLFLQELSPRWVEALEREGIFRRYPQGEWVVREDSFGTAILSRAPLTDVEVFDLAGLPQVRARVELDGLDVELLNVHTLPPRLAEYVAPHRAALDGILARVRALQGRPFLVAGDFNSTADSAFAARMAELADDGWRLAGSGFGATWPNGLFPVPPLRVDHLYLSRRLTVTRMSIGRGEGSDHRPLFATLARRAS